MLGKFWSSRTEEKAEHLLGYLKLKEATSSLRNEDYDQVREVILMIESQKDVNQAIDKFEKNLSQELKATYKVAWRQRVKREKQKQTFKTIKPKSLIDFKDEDLLVALDERGYDTRTIKTKFQVKRKAEPAKLDPSKTIAQNLASALFENLDILNSDDVQRVLKSFATYVKSAEGDAYSVRYVFTDGSKATYQVS